MLGQGDRGQRLEGPEKTDTREKTDAREKTDTRDLRNERIEGKEGHAETGRQWPVLFICKRGYMAKDSKSVLKTIICLSS